ncbi:uncharacterized protein LOC116292632 isoform X2 [Actinia tenebrosa]|uniref:Uncharacterized protein LOC116292632 isoform X1 n=1 Tax=Actinia tenebrosa TaxID=6105 RepID=A0A6P8HT78_ACTTE|nr:uncharacterized protein LOC116292632 isoform X1 [Actinia tenebrosa]XP_031555842.1 uncharacterized protein LOC116292632 isoform X2 [Actinia tenebrosa]
MATLIPSSLIGAAIEEFMNESSIQTYNNMETVGYTRMFDPKLLFLGKKDGPLKLCQNLLETVVNHPIFCTSRPTISVPSLMPSALDHLPVTVHELQFVTLGNKFNWRSNEHEGFFFVTDYETLKLEGTRNRREIPLEDFMEDQKLPRKNLFGVIYQSEEPVWLSSLHSAEIINFKKRLASTLRISMDRVYWVQKPNDFITFIEGVMYDVYRWRTDKECEENEKIVRGEFVATEESKKQELYDPVTMCYGDIPEKNGITLSEGV